MFHFLAKLESESVLRISGEDKNKYLHGQITVNTENWINNTARLAAHCDFKGKMWSSFYLSDYHDEFLVTGHDASNEASLRELKKYGVFSKVTIEKAEDLSIFGAAGDDAESILKEMFDNLPEKHLNTITSDYGLLIRLDYPQVDTNKAIYKCILNLAGQRILEDKGSKLLGNETLYNYAEVLACVGNIQQATVGEYVPQMFNLQLLHAIDFDKGCYMGQEVVARTKFLGKNKRALFLLKSSDVISDLTVGALLEKQIGENWRRGGQIIRIATNEENSLALAVLPNDTHYGDMLRLKDSEYTFTVLAHPYPFTQ